MPSRVEIQTYELKEISKSWDQKTWDEYLNWYQSSQSEKLIGVNLFNKISEDLGENIFSQFGFETNELDSELCRQILSTLPRHHQRILELIYFEGKTLAAIAKIFKRSITSIHQHKIKALTTLKRGNGGENVNARHYRGASEDSESQKLKSVWDLVLSSPVKSSRSYHAFNFQNELLNHQCLELREVFRNRSEAGLELVYLRYFCDLKIKKISKQKHLGLNAIEQILDAVVFKIKSELVENIVTDQQILTGQQGLKQA